MNNILLTGVGAYLPTKIIKNNDLDCSLNTSDEWIKKRTGISQRHISSDNETTSKMAINASIQALEYANLKNEDIDLIVLATTTPDETFPACAVKIQSELGIKHGSAFDVQAVCAGFIYALTISSSLIKSGHAKRALVIGSERFTKLLNWNDRSTCVLFGDGAGAVILEKSDDPGWGILSSNIHSDGRYKDLLYTDGGPGSNGKVGKVKMDGSEVFKHAIEKLSSCLEEALLDSNLSKNDIDFLIPHQANSRIIDNVAKKLNINNKKVIKTVDQHANTSAASIPLALNYAVKNGIVKNGDVLALEAIGGGLSWGAAIVKYGKPIT